MSVWRLIADVSQTPSIRPLGRLSDPARAHLAIEGALWCAAYRADLAAGRVRPGDHVVLFDTATGLKSPMPEAATTALDASPPIDYGAWS